MRRVDEASPVQGHVIRPEGATRAARKECAKWLLFRLSIGWREEELNDLETMWWRDRDKNGKFKPYNAALTGAADSTTGNGAE